MDNLRENKVYLILKTILFKSCYLCLKHTRIRNRFYYYSKWISDNGESAKFINYPLNTRSVVVDVGGYTGNFSDKILTLYNPHLTIIEPVKKYFKILKRKYSNNKKVTLYQLGLSNKNSLQKIYISDDGTSLIKKSKMVENIMLADAAIFLNKYKHIDLMSINIEGAEYDVLKRIIETGIIKRVKYLQVQFHAFVPGADLKRKDILENLLKTHRIRFSYPFVWESFTRRG